jgi:YggT family protein
MSVVVFHLINAVSWLLGIYSLIVLASCVISWVNPDPYNPIVRTLKTLTEPVLWRIRKLLPFTYMNGIDFSPLVLLLAIELFRRVVLISILDLLA